MNLLKCYFYYGKCDLMGQNQSHVTNHKRAEICILSENVKLCKFFVFIENKNTCVSFCHVN